MRAELVNEAVRREARRIEAELSRLMPPGYSAAFDDTPLDDEPREPYRTTAWVGKPREIEAYTDAARGSGRSAGRPFRHQVG